jgi:hypothetical protein
MEKPMTTTTMQVSADLIDKLRLMKISDSETYEDVIWDLLEDRMELSAETKKNIAQSEQEIKQGKFITLEDYKKKMRKNV